YSLRSLSLFVNISRCPIPLDSTILHLFFFSSRRRHTRSLRDWSSDVCSSDLTIRSGSNASAAGGRKSNDLARSRQPHLSKRIHAGRGDEPLPLWIFRRSQTRMPL